MRRKKDDLDRLTEKLLQRYPDMEEEMKKSGQAIDIAYQIYDLRKKAGLTQTQLAKLVHTSQANIARIESAEYESYTRKTLEKVAKALNARLEIKIVPADSDHSVAVPHK